MQFLCDEWLCDVATDYAGKCVVIACALTVIERHGTARAPGVFYCRRTTRRRKNYNAAHDFGRGSWDESGSSIVVSE